METVPFDVVLSFGIGLAAAWTARVQLEAAASPVANRWFVALLLFQGLLFCPLGAYLYAVHPGWSLNYLVDPAALPGWFGPVAIVAYAAFAVAGWLVGAREVRRGRAGRVLTFVAGVLAVLALMLLVFATRFWWVGPFEAFGGADRAAAMRPIVGTPLGWVLGGAGPIFVGVLAVMLWRNNAYGRRLEVPQN